MRAAPPITNPLASTVSLLTFALLPLGGPAACDAGDSAADDRLVEETARSVTDDDDATATPAHSANP